MTDHDETVEEIPESVFHSAHDEAAHVLKPWEVFVASDGENSLRSKTGTELVAALSDDLLLRLLVERGELVEVRAMHMDSASKPNLFALHPADRLDPYAFIYSRTLYARPQEDE